MPDFTTVISDKAVMDQSQISLFSEGVIIAAQPEMILSPLISQRKTGQKGASTTFIKFANLAAATTALTDGEDVTSEAVVDSQVVATPLEQGKVVTTTTLGDISTGGRLNAAVPELIGRNMGQSWDKIGIAILEAGTNVLTVDAGAESSLTATDIMTTAFMEKMYNKLKRASIPGIVGQNYAVVMHPDVVSDLRNVAAAGDFVDVNKYSNVQQVLKNEVGFFKGFKVIENANITVNGDAGDAAVDTYHSLFLGYNALGYVEALAPGLVVSGPFDKLKRLYNFGWYGVFAFTIIDQNAIWVGTTSSTYGENT